MVGSKEVGKLVGLIVAAMVIILLSASSAVFIPRWVADGDIQAIDKQHTEALGSVVALARKENAPDEEIRYKAVADSRSAFLQLLVALAGGVTVYFTWKNYTRSVKEAECAQALAWETRTSESFIKAVEQLGSASPAVRAGGVVGLGRLLRRAKIEGDYWPIMDVLTTFVRDQAPRRPESPREWKPSQDVQAALNVLARRSWSDIPLRCEDSPVDLHDTDLKLAWMSGGNFQGAFLSYCRLVEADMSHTNLSGAILTNADLTRADLTGAILDGANLADAEVTSDQLAVARGDLKTIVPPGVLRPPSWK